MSFIKYACKCGQLCHKNNLCGHGINAGVCCSCEECLAELEEEEEEEEEEEKEEKKPKEKKPKEKKPKKKPKLVLIIEEDEDEDEILTASLEAKIRNAGIPTLVSIYKEQFNRRISNMNASSIPLEKRKSLIVGKILEKCDTIEIKKIIMDTYFTKKEKEEKDVSWLNNFVVGEEVLIMGAKAQGKYSRTITRKGLIQKINKTSVSVRLFAYTEIDDMNAIENQTWGYNRLVWDNFTNDSQVIYSKDNIVKKGECKYRDEELIEGKKMVDYGN